MIKLPRFYMAGRAMCILGRYVFMTPWWIIFGSGAAIERSTSAGNQRSKTLVRSSGCRLIINSKKSIRWPKTYNNGFVITAHENPRSDVRHGKLPIQSSEQSHTPDARALQRYERNPIRRLAAISQKRALGTGRPAISERVRNTVPLRSRFSLLFEVTT